MFELLLLICGGQPFSVENKIPPAFVVENKIPAAESTPTPHAEITRVLGLLPKPAVGFVDFGCGADARWCIAAARKWGCRVTGVEIDPASAMSARDSVHVAGLANLVTIIEGDATKTDVTADVGVAYLYADTLEKLRPRLEKLTAFASYLHRPPGLPVTKNGDSWFYHRPQAIPTAVWGNWQYTHPVCDDPRCGMCASIRVQLAAAAQPRPQNISTQKRKTRSRRVLFISAVWCSHCHDALDGKKNDPSWGFRDWLKKAGWTIDETDSAHVQIVDYDKNPDIISRYGLQSVSLPLMIVVDNGREVRELRRGYSGRKSLTDILVAQPEPKQSPPATVGAPRDDIRVLQGQVSKLTSDVSALTTRVSSVEAKLAAQQKTIEVLTARVTKLEKPAHTFGIKPASVARAMSMSRSPECQTELDRISRLIDEAVAEDKDFVEPRGEYLKYVPNAPWGPSPLLGEVMENLSESGYDVGLLNYYPTTFSLVVRW